MNNTLNMKKAWNTECSIVIYSKYGEVTMRLSLFWGEK